MEVLIGGIVSLIVAIASGGGAWYAARAVNKKAPAEIISALSESAVNLVDPLNDAIQELRKEVDALKEVQRTERRECHEKILRLEAENNLLLRWATALIEQVTKLGGIPLGLDEIRRLDN